MTQTITQAERVIYKELADLASAVAATNAWNRVAIAFPSEAGTYKPGAHG